MTVADTYKCTGFILYTDRVVLRDNAANALALFCLRVCCKRCNHLIYIIKFKVRVARSLIHTITMYMEIITVT